MQKTRSAPPKVVVVGSANVDYRCRVKSLPLAGATVLATEKSVFTGGKGANQAIAASRMGVSTAFVGAVGDDSESKLLLDAFDNEDVTALVEVDPLSSTGVAYITVASDGQNQIVVVPGANSSLTVAAVLEKLRGLKGDNTWLVVSLEIPLEVVAAALDYAHERSWGLILNPAPASDGVRDLFAYGPIMTPNRDEALQLSGARTVEQAGALIRGETRNAVVITDGSRGAVLFERDGGVYKFPAPPARVVDTTGAGDTVTGVIAARLALGSDLRRAVAWAVVAAASSVEEDGARGGMPSAERLESSVAAYFSAGPLGNELALEEEFG